mgnify:CR=1 FL=1
MRSIYKKLKRLALPLLVVLAWPTTVQAGLFPPFFWQAPNNEPVQVGVFRVVNPWVVMQIQNWGPQLDLGLEQEFWDFVGNSRQDLFPQWRDKVKFYTSAYPGASPKLGLLLSAGSIFSLAPNFELADLGGPALVAKIPELVNAVITVKPAVERLRTLEPANVFYHNNQAMVSLLFTAGLGTEQALCHLERLRTLQNVDPDFKTEGRAAIPYTSGMKTDIKWVDYAIKSAEDCKTDICDWTSKEAPFKPIGMRMMLAELHQIRSTMVTDAAAKAADLQKVNEHLNDAQTLANARAYPYASRIQSLRQELANRTSYAPHPFPLMTGARFPMPVYANGQNCAGCHIGGTPGASGRFNPLPIQYPYANVSTPVPPPPSFRPANLDMSKCAL